MRFLSGFIAGAVLFGFTVPAFVQSQTSPPARPAPAESERSQVEIYKIVPGQHEAFLRWIARGDEALATVGQPPRQLYVHEDGADWDFLLIQPSDRHLTPAQRDKVRAERLARNIPTGPEYFAEYRKLLAGHTDTATEGPTSAGAWLAKLDASRRR